MLFKYSFISTFPQYMVCIFISHPCLFSSKYLNFEETQFINSVSFIICVLFKQSWLTSSLRYLSLVLFFYSFRFYTQRNDLVSVKFCVKEEKKTKDWQTVPLLLLQIIEPTWRFLQEICKNFKFDWSYNKSLSQTWRIYVLVILSLTIHWHDFSLLRVSFTSPTYCHVHICTPPIKDVLKYVMIFHISVNIFRSRRSRVPH